MAINFKKEHKSLSNEDMVTVFNGGSFEQEKKAFNKTAFYTPPAGLAEFKTPQQKMLVKFDVLEFKLTNPIHKTFIKARKYDVKGLYYWNYIVSVHEAFPKNVVCKRNFELGKDVPFDDVCTYLWNHKEIDFKQMNKDYTILLLRVHPNQALGITDYTFMYHIDTYGKLAKSIADALQKASAREDYDKLNFSKWDESGLTVEAFFSEQKTPNNFTYFGCNDVNFVTRKDQITDADAEFLYELDMCSGVTKPTSEDYKEFVEHVKSSRKQKLTQRHNSEEAPVEVLAPTMNSPRDKVFSTMDDDDDPEGWATAEG